MCQRKRGNRILVVGHVRNRFLININPIAPTFACAMNERVDTPLGMMHVEGINHGKRRDEFLPGGSHHVVPMAHAAAFVYVLVRKVEVTDNDIIVGDVVYLQELGGNVDHFSLRKLFNLTGVIYRQVVRVSSRAMDKTYVKHSAWYRDIGVQDLILSMNQDYNSAM